MGLPTGRCSALALLTLLAACGSPESRGNPFEPTDGTAALSVTSRHVVIHVAELAPAGGDGSGQFPFQNLPEAMAAAHAIDGAVTIQVGPGDYVLTQPLAIDRPLDLRGSTAQVASTDPWPTGQVTPGTQTRILASDPLASYALVRVGRDDGTVIAGVAISGFVFDGTATGSDLFLFRVQDYRVTDNVFHRGNFALLSEAASGRVTGNHFSSANTGAIFGGGYPASPSHVQFSGNRSVHNNLGGVLLNGVPSDLPELGDELDATIRDNDLSENTANPNQGFGVRVFVVNRPIGGPGSSQSSAHVHALVAGNRIDGNRIGITVDAGFPFRRVGTVCDTRVYSGNIELTLAGNTVTGSLLTPGLVTFTRQQAALTMPSMLALYQYLHGATFVVDDRDGTLASAWIDHPSSDPFLGPCPGDAAHEPLQNVLVYNGVPLLNGTNF